VTRTISLNSLTTSAKRIGPPSWKNQCFVAGERVGHVILGHDGLMPNDVLYAAILCTFAPMTERRLCASGDGQGSRTSSNQDTSSHSGGRSSGYYGSQGEGGTHA
jgi:hypothetical protein